MEKKNNIPARQKDNRKTWGEKNQSANVNTTKLGNSKPSVAAAASSLRFEFFFFLILVFFFNFLQQMRCREYQVSARTQLCTFQQPLGEMP